jgi:hypothetical protein
MKINSQEEIDKLTGHQLEHIYTAMLNEASFDPSAHNDEQAKAEAMKNLAEAKETILQWERILNAWVHMGKEGLDEDELGQLEWAKRGVENLVDWQY